MVKKRVLLLLLWGLILFWSFTAPSLYAKGKSDEDLSHADALIAEKHYDDAIRVLTAFSRKHPDRFTEAQSRLQKIYRIRDEYIATAQELLDIIGPESNSADRDNERMLYLISRLEEIESNNNPKVFEFVGQVHDLALFNYNRQRLGNILVQGRERLDRGDYEGALEIYFSGMDLYRNDFFQAGYGAEIERRVNEGIDKVNTVAASFAQASTPIAQTASDLLQALNQNAPITRIEDLFNRMNETLGSLIDLQQLLYATAAYYDEQLLVFQKDDSGIGDRSFLSFASILIQGRSGETVQEGMLGVLEQFWNSTVIRVAKVMQNRTDSVYATGLAFANNRDFAQARQSFIFTYEYCRYPIALLERNSEFKRGSNSRFINIYNQGVLMDDLEMFLKYDSMNESIRYLNQSSEIGVVLDAFMRIEKDSVEQWNSRNITLNEVFRREQEIRGTLDAVNTDVDMLLAQVNQKESELRIYQAELDEEAQGSAHILEYISNARAVIDNLKVLIVNEQRNSIIRYYTVANTDLQNRAASRREQYTEGNRLIAGVTRTTDTGGTLTEHYPSEGLVFLTAMLQTLNADIRDAEDVLARFNREPREFAAIPAVADIRASTQAAVSDLKVLQSTGQELSVSARRQIAQADAYRLDGVRYYREAQNALSRQEFNTARDRITRSSDQFNNSLAIQESAALRNEWDTQLLFLGREISRIENEVVIRDVRALVTNARNAYFGGDFERAEELLIRAQNRWLVTNSGNDEEVDYWLNMVRGAVSLRSGRVIPPTAPLFPEMSQLLSDARKAYDEGVRFLNAGQRNRGIEKFNEARMKTRDVMLMFPVNQEAGMLNLMIDRVIDPRAFDADFERRLRTAVAGTERRSIESFAELQNLAEINPRYPGMAGIINRAEIAMGIRPPPPDPRAIARSNEQTASAQRILDGNMTTQFEVALAQVNEAISLNPNNNQATVIKDRIQSRVARPSSIVMSSQDEALYNQALMEYQRGNYIMAMAIVQRLLQNPQYRNIAKVLELQRRVQVYL